MSVRTVQFYFDYGSPYSYMGSHLIEGVCERGGAELQWMPMVIGGLYKAHGTEPPLSKPVKMEYMSRDLENVARHLGVSYKPRTEFLFNPIMSMRATLAAPQGAERGKAVHALFKGAWAEDLNLGDADVVLRILEAAGIDGKPLLERTQEQEIKDELKSNTDAAIAMGIFGAPATVIDGKGWFWGHDRLDMVEKILKENG